MGWNDCSDDYIGLPYRKNEPEQRASSLPVPTGHCTNPNRHDKVAWTWTELTERNKNRRQQQWDSKARGTGFIMRERGRHINVSICLMGLPGWSSLARMMRTLGITLPVPQMRKMLSCSYSLLHGHIIFWYTLLHLPVYALVHGHIVFWYLLRLLVYLPCNSLCLAFCYFLEKIYPFTFMVSKVSCAYVLI